MAKRSVSSIAAYRALIFAGVQKGGLKNVRAEAVYKLGGLVRAICLLKVLHRYRSDQQLLICSLRLFRC